MNPAVETIRRKDMGQSCVNGGFAPEFKDFTDKELGDIIVAFCTCGTRDTCDSCPCDGVLCGYSFHVEPRKQFALEVAKRLNK